MKTVSEILNAAADLIEPEGMWTQGAYCRDALGNGEQNLFDLNLDADCFCMAGAVARVGGTKEVWDFLEPVASFLCLGFVTYITSWNDAPDRTQAEVVAALRAAAKAAE